MSLKQLSYFPGCSLHSTAREYDASARAIFQALDIELRELEDWNCCGSTSAHSIDRELARLLPGRNLGIAQEAGLDLLIPCAACYSRSKAADAEVRASSLAERVEINHILEFLARDDIFERLAALITEPLTGLKAVCYYGCLTTRPPNVLGLADYEDPQSMDRLVELAGATALPWSFKTDCCGASLTLSRADVVIRLVGRLLSMAEEAEAECIVVACTMCHVNLDARQSDVTRKKAIPIFYISELLGLAMGLAEAPRWLDRHLVNARDLLIRKGRNVYG